MDGSRKKSLTFLTDDVNVSLIPGLPNELLLWAEYPYKNDIWYSYFPSTDTWLKLPVMPENEARSGGISAFAVDDEKLFVIGGESETKWNPRRKASSIVICFDMKLYKWIEMPPLNVARTACFAGVIDNQLYVFSGKTPGCKRRPPDDDGYHTTTVEVYDPMSGKWRMRSRRNSSGYVLDGIAVGKKFCVVYAVKDRSILEGAIYDSESNKWLDMPPGLNFGWSGNAVEFDGKICIKKESWHNPKKRETSIMVYKSANDTWEVIHGQQPLESDYQDHRGKYRQDEGDQLVNLDGNLCTARKFREDPGLRFEIRDLTKRVIASNSFMPTSVEKLKDTYIQSGRSAIQKSDVEMDDKMIEFKILEL